MMQQQCIKHTSSTTNIRTMDLLYQQAQENFPKILKELVERPDFDMFIKSQPKEEFAETFFGLMKVYCKYQEYIKPQEKIPEVDNNEVIKMTEKIFDGIGAGNIVAGDIISIIKGDCSEEKLIELGKKFASCFEESPSEEKSEDMVANSN